MGQAFDAKEYDDRIRRTLPYYEEFYRQIAGILKAAGKEELRWLDIGCGTGRMYEAARRELTLREFTFSDVSEKMLAVAKGRFQGPGRRFERTDVLDLTAKDSYDVITAVLVHHYMKEADREKAVTKCMEALKSGGFFFSFENIAPCSGTGLRLSLQRWHDAQVENGVSVEEADRHGQRYGTEYFPITVEEQLQLLRKCGFRSVELIWMSYMQAGFMGIKE